MNQHKGRLFLSVQRSVLGAAMVGCMLVSGCQMGAGDDVGVDSRQFADVRVPEGFRLKDRTHESFSREEATWRHARFVYSGSTRIDQAAAYVLGHMPQHSWKTVDDQKVDDKRRRLRFERGIYSADYVFTRADGVTQIVVDYATDYKKR